MGNFDPNRDPETVAQWHQLAIDRLAMGDLDRAWEAIAQAMTRHEQETNPQARPSAHPSHAHPSHADPTDGQDAAALHRTLAAILQEMDDWVGAATALETAIARDPTCAVASQALGSVRATLGDRSGAAMAWEQAIALAPTDPTPYRDWAQHQADCGHWAGAIATLRRGVAAIPDAVVLWEGLGWAGQATGDLVLVYHAQARAAYGRGNWAGVVAAYRAWSLVAGTAALTGGDRERWAKSCEALEDWDAARSQWQAAIAQDPQNPWLYVQLAFAWEQSADPDHARATLQAGLVACVQDCAAEHLDAEDIQPVCSGVDPAWVEVLRAEQWRMGPIVIPTVAELVATRDRHEAGLRAWIATGRARLAADPAIAPQFLPALAWRTRFYAHYWGFGGLDPSHGDGAGAWGGAWGDGGTWRDRDRQSQQRYGAWVAEVMAALLPPWDRSRSPQPVPNRPLRIGYLSAGLCWHTVSTVFGGWLRGSDRLWVAAYAVELAQADAVTDAIAEAVDQFTVLPRAAGMDAESLADWCRAVAAQIRGDRLDGVVFLDVGMVPAMTLLAGMRLAPVQCAAWGHPITTGSPVIDYFFSSAWLEPPDGDRDYTETLIRLPDIGIDLPRPAIPTVTPTRADFGCVASAPLYLACQSRFKYLPQADRLYADLARAVPTAQLVFVATETAPLEQAFRDRLAQTFTAAGLDLAAHCRFLPHLAHTDYWHLLQLADVILDTPGFTGFLTTLDAIACGKPVVTLAGPVLRSRQSAGILTGIGCPELIATHRVEYVEIAARLGRDPAWRSHLGDRMRAGCDRLFHCPTAFPALEQFWEDVSRSTIR